MSYLSELRRVEPAAPCVTVERVIPSEWTDFNGHMNEAWYAHLFAEANDVLCVSLGADDAYLAATGSYFTAEGHIRYLGEMLAGEAVRMTTQVIKGEGKKLHLFHSVYRADQALSATGEYLLIHVDLKTRRSSDPSSPVSEGLAAFQAAHAGLPLPEGAGRAVRS